MNKQQIIDAVRNIIQYYIFEPADSQTLTKIRQEVRQAVRGVEGLEHIAVILDPDDFSVMVKVLQNGDTITVVARSYARDFY